VNKIATVIKTNTVRKNQSIAATLLPTHPPLPLRNITKLGRPAGQSPDIVRTRILDCAEQLFAEFGYDGTSVRDIASACGCQVQAIGHHFGPKDRLFDAVVLRRAVIMSNMRLEALATAKKSAKGKSIKIERLVHDYAKPFILSAHDGNQGWRNYAVLMGRLANSPRGTEVIAQHYDATAQTYLAEFYRSLPKNPKSAVVDGFMFMVAAMLVICANTGRSEKLDTGNGNLRTADMELKRLTQFVTAGFKAI
jgi:AcrR family transcriptional regulator